MEQELPHLLVLSGGRPHLDLRAIHIAMADVIVHGKALAVLISPDDALVDTTLHAERKDESLLFEPVAGPELHLHAVLPPVGYVRVETLAVPLIVQSICPIAVSVDIPR